MPQIRAAYTAHVAKRCQSTQTENEASLKLALDAILQEEGNAARLHEKGKMSDEVYEELWREWQDRRNKTIAAMSTLHSHDATTHVETLDAALKLIAKAGILFEKLERQRKRDLLRYMVEHIIIDMQGRIVRVELRAPFGYLRELICENSGGAAAKGWFDLGSAGPILEQVSQTTAFLVDFLIRTQTKPVIVQAHRSYASCQDRF